MVKITTIIIANVLLCLSGCSMYDNTSYHDPHLKLNKEDYYKFWQQQVSKLPTTIIKKKKPVKAKLPAKFYEKISVSTDEELAIKEILLLIAQQAGLNIIMDSKISGQSIIHAMDQQAIEIIANICTANKLKYTIDGEIINITPDSPYLRHYHLQFLAIKRSNQNKFSIATNVLATGEQNNSTDNGSNTIVTASNEMDFWPDLAKNIKLLLQATNTNTDKPNKYTINTQAGLISIYAPQAVQRQIAKYFKMVKQSIDKQVLIEAKIIEVSLHDEFNTGIEWDTIHKSMLFNGQLNAVSSGGTKIANVFNLGHQSTGLKRVLGLLNHFGTIRTLSNPRLTVLNNNISVLKVAKNEVYFKIQRNRDFHKVAGSNDITRDENFSSEIKTVPVGLMMYVHPIIRPDGKIILALRPTISKVVHRRLDPLATENNKQQSLIPEIQVRELDSILAMQSGETVVVGGLMEDNSTNNTNGPKELRQIPILGKFLQGKHNERAVTELVIFIKATILESSGSDFIYAENNLSLADKNIINGPMSPNKKVDKLAHQH